MPVELSGGGVVLSENFWGTSCTILASGVRFQDFRFEAPENGAEGAVLEIFFDFSEKLSLKNAIKIKNFGA